MLTKAYEVIPRSCREEGDLPSIEGLEQRIKCIVALQGLDVKISPSVVDMMSNALDVNNVYLAFSFNNSQQNRSYTSLTNNRAGGN